jgi:prepilin-type N-terminal cleavage/methylation domain-containing protein
VAISIDLRKGYLQGLELEITAAEVTQRLKASKGFTLIELIVVIAIISTLMGVLLSRVWFYQEQAEKAAMQQVAGALQSSLILQYSQLLARDQTDEIKNLISRNPINLLMRPPKNYVGEFNGLAIELIPPGNWGFDLKSRELIYIPFRTQNFKPDKDGKKIVRFRARVEYGTGRGGPKSRAGKEVTGVAIEPVEPYQWNTEEK